MLSWITTTGFVYMQFCSSDIIANVTIVNSKRELCCLPEGDKIWDKDQLLLLYRTSPMPGSSFSSPDHTSQLNKNTTQRLVHETEGGTFNHTRARTTISWVTSGAVTRMCGSFIRAAEEGKQNPSLVFKPLYPFNYDYSYGKCFYWLLIYLLCVSE